MTVAYIYVRVSSAAQATGQNASLDVQVENCSAFMRSQYPDVQYTIVNEVFSGRVLANQKKLNEILSEIKPKDILVFYNVSRLSRDSSTAISILSKLSQQQIRIHSVVEKLTYPGDRATFRRLFVDANEESDVISDRVRGAMAYIRDRQGHIGATAFGYKAERQKPESGRTYCLRKVVSNTDEMAVIHQIIHYVDSTTELDDIAATKGVGICNVIADTLNAKGKFCRGKPWTPFRVRDIYKTFTKTNVDYDGEPCEICQGLVSKKDNPIILCDGCDKGFHMKCVALSTVPLGNFYCSMLCQFKKM